MSALILPQRASDRQMIEKEPEMRRGEEVVVVVGLSLLCMSQQMKKLAEKRHLLVVTLVSPGSHRIMSRVAVAD